MPLDVAFDPAAPPRQFRPAAPLGVALALGSVLALAAGARALGWVEAGAVRVAGVPVVHGTLLMMALASADPRWRRHSAALSASLAGAAAATHLGAWGAIAYLAVPLGLIAIASRQPGGALIGLCRPATWQPLIIGAAAGLFLGGHILVSASRTFGYEVRVAPLDRYLATVAYDVGANVPSAECFFRGVVFNAAQRRWSFGAATALATGATLLRYLVDPALPRSVETITGAMFYLTLLGVANCWLFRRSGSVLPGILAGIGFFAAYRALGGWW